MACILGYFLLPLIPIQVLSQAPAAARAHRDRDRDGVD